jgi:hypothetical protein
MHIKIAGPNELRTYEIDIGDGKMKIWVTFDEENPNSDDIVNCISLAKYDFGPSEIDGLLEYPYGDFLADVEGLRVEPPKKDYGLNFQNIIAWHLNAHGQKAADIENRYDAGFYKVRGTITMPDGLESRIGYWLQATSSEDARRQFRERSNYTARDMKVEQFSAEEPDLGPGDIAEELP